MATQPAQMNFTLCIGENRPLVITVTDADGNPIDISGWSMEFGVHAPGAPNFITKTTGDATIVLTAPAIGQATIYIVPDDTDDASPGNFNAYAKRTNTGFVSVLMLGEMILVGT